MLKNHELHTAGYGSWINLDILKKYRLDKGFDCQLIRKRESTRLF